VDILSHFLITDNKMQMLSWLHIFVPRADTRIALHKFHQGQLLDFVLFQLSAPVCRVHLSRSKVQNCLPFSLGMFTVSSPALFSPAAHNANDNCTRAGAL
jgi:hypothetical protein